MKPPSLLVQSVVQWLVHGARNAPLSQEVLTELCERLTAAGLPLWRVTVFVRTLHPEIVGRRFVWHPETGTVVTDACRKYGGFYLGSIGGPAARLAKDCITKVDVLEYPELGMEAVWKIEVVDFPAFIVVDDKGNDFFKDSNLG